MQKLQSALHLSARGALFIKRTAIFVLFVVVGIDLYKLFLERALQGRPITGFLALWAFSAYLVLPRLHRRLSKWYLPDYYIGRVRTSDGLLGDPVNLALHGNKRQLVRAMKAAGWVQADDLNLRSSWGMVKSTLLRKSYPEAPVSSLFLFGNMQELAFQQEVDNNPAKRHHVRFWRTPKGGWLLPGGFAADWLGAATYDRSVGFSTLTLQITHKIEEDTDIERDYVVSTVLAASPKATVYVHKDYSTGYHCKNGGGDAITTDGALPFIDLRNV